MLTLIVKLRKITTTIKLFAMKIIIIFMLIGMIMSFWKEKKNFHLKKAVYYSRDFLIYKGIFPIKVFIEIYIIYRYDQAF
jgi:hypothetical protein